MRIDHAVTVDAPAERAYAVLADVHRWPEFMSALERVRILRRDGARVWVEMHEAEGRVRDVPEYRVDFRPGAGLRAVQVRGAFRSGEVEWTLRPDGDRTRVEVRHRFEPGRPLVGPLVDRWIVPALVRRIAGRSLANFRSLVETGRPPKARASPAGRRPKGTAMIHTENSVIVRAPADAVYAAAEDKAKFPEFIPHIRRSDEESSGGRVRYHMAARMKWGIPSRWVSERVAEEPGRWAEFRTTGFCRQMSGRWSVEPLAPGDDGAPRTRLALTHDFDVGHPILRRCLPLDRIVRTLVEDNSQRMLEAIRARVEARRASGCPREAVHV